MSELRTLHSFKRLRRPSAVVRLINAWPIRYEWRKGTWPGTQGTMEAWLYGGTRWGASYVETTTGWVHEWRGGQRRVPVVLEWRDRCRWDRGPIASWRELRSVVHWRTDGLQLLWSSGVCGWVLLKPWGTKDTVGSKPNAWSMTELDCGHQLHHMSPGVV